MHVPGYIKNTSDASLITQWQTMGAIGKAVVPPLTLLASGANFLNAYLTNSPSQRYRFIAAGILSFSVLPYTVMALASTNAELAAREGKGSSPSPELKKLTLEDLIQRWGDRSAVRGFLFLASTVVCYDAMLQLTF